MNLCRTVNPWLVQLSIVEGIRLASDLVKTVAS